MVLPRRPPIVKAFRIEAQVVLEVTVGQNGRVPDVRPQSGTPLLVEAAEEAVRQWRYAPSSRPPAGRTVVFEFQLGKADADQTKLERSDAGHSADLGVGFTRYASEYIPRTRYERAFKVKCYLRS
jgi:TonB family protein